MLTRMRQKLPFHVVAPKAFLPGRSIPVLRVLRYGLGNGTVQYEPCSFSDHWPIIPATQACIRHLSDTVFYPQPQHYDYHACSCLHPYAHHHPELPLHYLNTFTSNTSLCPQWPSKLTVKRSICLIPLADTCMNPIHSCPSPKYPRRLSSS